MMQNGGSMNPFHVVRDFEAALADYTGAPYVVAVNSCTAALRLALMWWCGQVWSGRVYLPRKTYPSVPMAVKKAGFDIGWLDHEWNGVYRLEPTNIWDCAKRLTGDMYVARQFQCVSFHPQKPLGLSNGGGAILHDNQDADSWFRRMRFDGRTEGVPTKDDTYTMIGEHVYMMPPTAAEGLHRLSIYARQYYHEDQPMDDYPDMGKSEIFGDGA